MKNRSLILPVLILLVLGVIAIFIGKTHETNENPISISVESGPPSTSTRPLTQESIKREGPNAVSSALANTTSRSSPKPEQRGESAKVGARDGRPSSYLWHTREELSRAVSSAWIGGPEHMDPHDPEYERALLKKAELKKDTKDPWSFTTWRDFRGGLYRGILTGLKRPGEGEEPAADSDTSNVQEFYTALNKVSFPDGRIGLRPVWIAWKHYWSASGEPSPNLDTHNFQSPFEKDEVYFAAIHFPPNVFGPIFDEAGSQITGSCKEVILVSSFNTSLNNQYIDTINGRVYSRRERTSLIPMGQFSLSPFEN